MDHQFCTEVLPVDAPHDEWLALRRQGIGGSDCSAIMGMNRFASAYTVWEDKTGRAPAEPESEAMRWGNLLEPVIREETARRLGLTVTKPGTLRSLEHPWQQYNPDGLFGDGGLLECKNTSAWMSGDWDGQVPDHAELQVQHGMAVTGAPHAYVAGLVGGNRLVVERVERDDALIALITATEHAFWTEHVLADEPPRLDASEATHTALLRRFPLVDRSIEVDPDKALPLAAMWAAAAAQEKAGKAAKKHAENEFRLLMEGATTATVDGLVIARVTGGTWAPKRFEADNPDVADLYRKKIEVIDSAAVKSEQPELWRKYQAQVFKAYA